VEEFLKKLHEELEGDNQHFAVFVVEAIQKQDMAATLKAFELLQEFMLTGNQVLIEEREQLRKRLNG
jgi:hypothetical protein